MTPRGKTIYDELESLFNSTVESFEGVVVTPQGTSVHQLHRSFNRRVLVMSEMQQATKNRGLEGDTLVVRTILQSASMIHMRSSSSRVIEDVLRED
jgi:hypothetical protein